MDDAAINATDQIEELIELATAELRLPKYGDAPRRIVRYSLRTPDTREVVLQMGYTLEGIWDLPKKEVN